MEADRTWALDLPVRVSAPGKVNLCLYVGSRLRPDGYHDICSIFQPISLADEIRVERAQQSGDTVVCPGVDGTNLALSAAMEFRRRFAPRLPPLKIGIVKRIPVAAGLGGGSADAAAILRALSRIVEDPPTDAGLMEVARRLGSDVPSQLSPCTALVHGAGEIVEPIDPPAGCLSFVLLPIAGGLSTPTVYSEMDRMRGGTSDMKERLEALRATASSGLDLPSVRALMHNDLEPAAIRLEPRVAQSLAALRQAGALAAIVSGSGPTAFGLFDSDAHARSAADALAERSPIVTGAARPGSWELVARSPESPSAVSP